MIVQDVCKVMDDWAPPGLAYAWDKVGLRIGRPDAPVTHVVVALTVTDEVLTLARRVGAEMIVSHHPPLWRPLEVIRTDDPETRLLVEMASAGVSCYAAHTNLDLAPDGVNRVLADRLGLAECRPLVKAPQAAQVKLVTFVPESHLASVRDAVCAAGAGTIGTYTHCTFSVEGVGTFHPLEGAQPYSGVCHTLNEERERRLEVLAPKVRLDAILEALMAAHPYEEVAYDVVVLENRDQSVGLGMRGVLACELRLDEFAARVRDALQVSHVRMVGNEDHRVRCVAVIGGAGAGEVRNVAHDVDVLVTGDITYHHAVDAVARGLALIDAGHAGTEKFIVPAMAERLRRELPALQVTPFVEPDVFRMV